MATPAAGLAGMLMTVDVMPVDMSPLYSWCLGIIVGGGAASGVQLVTVGARTVSTASTGGAGNHLVSTGEAAGAFAISISALFAPIIIAAIVITAFCVMVYLNNQERRQVVFREKISLINQTKKGT
jgi:Na+-transporting methylmalonyl-CoA/oxaloacetate decarboxylase beta subunit